MKTFVLLPDRQLDGKGQPRKVPVGDILFCGGEKVTTDLKVEPFVGILIHEVPASPGGRVVTRRDGKLVESRAKGGSDLSKLKSALAASAPPPPEPEAPAQEPVEPEAPVQEPVEPEAPVQEPVEPEAPVQEPVKRAAKKASKRTSRRGGK